MKLIFFVTAMVFCGMTLHSQAIKYTYDASGNRETREKVVTLIKSSEFQDDKDEEDQRFDDLVGDYNITIYPNPTKGFLQVDINGGKIPQNANICLYNSLGGIVRQINGISNSNTVDISIQPSGVYIMHISIDIENISTWKIIKE